MPDQPPASQQERPALTPREHTVIELLIVGHGRRQIAEQLRIGERTVDRVIATVVEKFSALDPKIAGIGYVGRTARVIALYTQSFKPPPDAPAQHEPLEQSSSPLVRLSVRSELEEAHVVVEVGRGGPRDEHEERRIRQSGALTTARFARRVSLTLELERPVLLRRYKLRWRPSD